MAVPLSFRPTSRNTIENSSSQFPHADVISAGNEGAAISSRIRRRAIKADSFIQIALDTEEALLASLLYDWPDDHWAEQELLNLRPKHFARESNGIIFQAILNLRSKGESCDFLSVAHELQLKYPKDWEGIAGRDYFKMLAEIMRDHAMTFLHIRGWAKTIRVNYAIRSGRPIFERSGKQSSITDGGVEL